MVAVKEGKYGVKEKVLSWLYQILDFRTQFALLVKRPLVGFLLGLLFGPEYEVIKFLRNVGGLPLDHTALRLTRQQRSLKNRITVFWDATLCCMVAGAAWSMQLKKYR
jgi:hypothetical protein